MLHEFKNVRQIPSEGLRRWFRDENFDLIIWYDPDADDTIEGFQLCYDKQVRERALTWRRGHGYSHHRIDDGEEPYAPKQSPILVQDGSFTADRVTSDFRSAAGELDSDITELVLGVLSAYPRNR